MDKNFKSNRSEIPTQSMGLQSKLYKLYYVNQQTTVGRGGGLIYHSSQKRYPFRIPASIDKWYPFHIPCLELCILLTVVNALLFKWESITKIERFLDFRKSHKIYLLALWALSQTQLTDTSTSKIPTLSYTRSLKKVPLSGRASHVGHHREYPLLPHRPLRIHC